MLTCAHAPLRFSVDEGDVEGNVDEKMNLHFTYDSLDTLEFFTLFITVKAITKLSLGHRDKFEIER